MAKTRTRYSEEFKRQAVSRTAAEPDRIPDIARELGLDLSLLYRWRRQHAAASVSPSRSLEMGSGREVELRPVGEGDTAELAALASDLRLRRSLLDAAFTIIAAIGESSPGAPLNQLTAALAVIMDRLLKLEALAPDTDDAGSGEQVIRIEYKYPDGSIHYSPPWAEGDPAFEAPIIPGQVRSPFWGNDDETPACDPDDDRAWD